MPAKRARTLHLQGSHRRNAGRLQPARTGSPPEPAVPATAPWRPNGSGLSRGGGGGGAQCVQTSPVSGARVMLVTAFPSRVVHFVTATVWVVEPGLTNASACVYERS